MDNLPPNNKTASPDHLNDAPLSETVQEHQAIPFEMAGKRLDQALAKMFPDFSRARIQQWIRDGQISVDDAILRPRDKVKGGESIHLMVSIEAETTWQPQDIPLNIIYEDDDIIVINKPVGLVVHPAAGNRDGTLLNALLFHAPELALVPRAGIVHRLDKNTSGLLVVARNISAQHHLTTQIQAHAFEREYQAIVYGAMIGGGTVDEPIGRDPIHRTRMAVVHNGRPSVTHYRLIKRFNAHSHIRVTLETGRTHQIRVHMAHLRYPLIGDSLYGGRLRLPKGGSEKLNAAMHGFNRQALHAARLGITHPSTKENISWEAPLPDDMKTLLEALADNDKQYLG